MKNKGFKIIIIGPILIVLVLILTSCTPTDESADCCAKNNSNNGLTFVTDTYQNNLALT